MYLAKYNTIIEITYLKALWPNPRHKSLNIHYEIIKKSLKNIKAPTYLCPALGQDKLHP